MSAKRVGVVLFVIALLVLGAGVASNLIAYGEAIQGDRDFVTVAWDFDGRFSSALYEPWDWSFYPGVFNAIGAVCGAIAAMLYFGARDDQTS